MKPKCVPITDITSGPLGASATTWTNPATGGVFVACASGEYAQIKKVETAGTPPSIKYVLDTCIAAPCPDDHHIQHNYNGTGVAFCVPDEVPCEPAGYTLQGGECVANNIAGCEVAGYVKLGGVCAPPTRCRENSLVDTTVAPFVCTCRAGVTIRYLSADGAKCVDSCFAAAESREMGYDVYYPFKEVGT